MRKISMIAALGLVLVLGLAMQAAAEPFPIGQIGTDVGTVVSTFESTITVPKANETFNATTVPPPYATVDVFVYSTGQASLEFTALNDYFLGDILGANLKTPDTAVESSIVFSGPFPNNAPSFLAQSATTPNQISSTFGDFNLNLSFFDAFGNGFKDVSFLLSGTGYTNAASILALNDNGFDAYVHVGDLSITPNITGFAAEGAAVPLPPSVLLMGSGLLSLAGLGWRRRVKA